LVLRSGHDDRKRARIRHGDDRHGTRAAGGAAAAIAAAATATEAAATASTAATAAAAKAASGETGRNETAQAATAAETLAAESIGATAAIRALLCRGRGVEVGQELCHLIGVGVLQLEDFHRRDRVDRSVEGADQLDHVL